VSVNEKKWLVMHMHVQLKLDKLRGPPSPCVVRGVGQGLWLLVHPPEEGGFNADVVKACCMCWTHNYLQPVSGCCARYANKFNQQC
jgi:hypothetical protein